MKQQDSILIKMLAILLAIPLVGGSILAIRMSMDWTPQNTQFVLGSVASICGIGLAMFGAIFAIVLSIPLAMRLMDRNREQIPPPGWMAPMDRPSLTYREPHPPLPMADGQGAWRSNGTASYDVWTEDELQEQDWQTAGRSHSLSGDRS